MRREKGILSRLSPPTKENDGTAKRRQTLKQISGIIFVTFLVILIIELTGIKVSSDQNEASEDDDVARNKLLSKISRANYGLRNPRQEDRKNVDPEIMKLIVEGNVNLFDLSIDISTFREHSYGSYSGVIGHFCPIPWSLHKKDPSQYPMFRFLVQQSAGCNKPLQVDLKEAVQKAKEYDISHGTKHHMTPKGFVFHESRCGSTLVANSLAAMDPSKNRVYSESHPPLQALQSCGDDQTLCNGYQAVQLFRDVVYLMGRTNDPMEENLFFKIQSLGSKSIAIATEAFPTVPWIYVYRDPVQVMMSHIKDGVRHANCVRQLARSNSMVKNILNSKGLTFSSLTPEQKCALHLSTLCDSAVRSLLRSDRGRAVKYELLPNILIDSIFPDHFNMELTPVEEERIVKISGTYSKGKGEKRDWKEDSSQKDREATSAVRSAAGMFLAESFHELQKH